MYLITTYREPVRNHDRLNHKLPQAQNIIEWAFWVMKTRWRTVILKDLKVSPTFVPEVITCCAILNKICMNNGNVLEEDLLESDDDGDLPGRTGETVSGDTLRDTLSAAVSAPDVAVPTLQDDNYF